MTQTTKYETGATSHAVNDLILFTDNTRELAELRDRLFKDWTETGTFGTTRLFERFMPLLTSSIATYIKKFPDKESHNHIWLMSKEERIEFCQLYVNDFENWKTKHGY